MSQIWNKPYISCLKRINFICAVCMYQCKFSWSSSNIFQPDSTGEQKTKPTQNSVREMRGLGLSPDLVRYFFAFDFSVM